MKSANELLLKNLPVSRGELYVEECKLMLKIEANSLDDSLFFIMDGSGN